MVEFSDPLRLKKARRHLINLTSSINPASRALTLPLGLLTVAEIMRKPAPLLLLSIAFLLFSGLPVKAAFFDFITGGSDTPAAESPTSRDETAAKQLFADAQALENAGDLTGALKGYRNISKNYSQTTDAAKAQMRVGKILEQQGQLNNAFKAYSDYVTKYARGSEFDAAVQAQYNIATVYLGGEKKRILGIAIAPQYERAREMFEEIVKKAPYHSLAPQAQFNVGQALEKQGKPTEAIMAYQEILSRYPSDAIADDAQYQIGYVQYILTQDGSYDNSTRQKAKESFEDFVNRNPTNEKTSQAKQNLKALSGNDVKGTMDIAKFYDKTKNYRAAVIYYNDVIKQAPGSAESDAAKARVEELRSLVGDDKLRTGPERAESGATASARRKTKARVDIASRPDFNGPPIIMPEPVSDAPGRPRLRTGGVPGSPYPAVEPPLPSTDPLQGTVPGDAPSAEPLIPPTLPPPEADMEEKEAPTQPAN